MNKLKLKMYFQRICALFCALLFSLISIFAFVPSVAAASLDGNTRSGFFSLKLTSVINTASGVNVQVFCHNAAVSGDVYRIQIFDENNYRYVVLNQSVTIYRNDYGFFDPSFQYFYFNLTDIDYDLLVSFDYFFEPVSELYFDMSRIDFYEFDQFLHFSNLNSPLVSLPLNFTITCQSAGSNLSAINIIAVFLPQMFYTNSDGAQFAVYLDDDSWVDVSYQTLSNITYMSPQARMFLYAHGEFHFSPPPSFLERLGSGFTAAIGWLGHFFTSLFTSNLALAFVLVSVGFGLALLSFGWRWIRRWLWGY